MLGQLTDAGNTVTLAHYLELLQGAGMIAGLSKYAHGLVRQRGSSPKFQVCNHFGARMVAHPCGDTIIEGPHVVDDAGVVLRIGDFMHVVSADVEICPAAALDHHPLHFSTAIYRFILK